jgi:hypothetical protein
VIYIGTINLRVSIIFICVKFIASGYVFHLMNKTLSLLAATMLALVSFYSTCWYAPYPGYSYILLLVVVGLFLYMIFLYMLYRIRSQKVSKKETTETVFQV